MKRIYIKHSVIWIIYSVILYFIFINSSEHDSAFRHVLLFVTAQIITFYSNVIILIPLFYKKNAFILYGLYNVILLIFNTILITTLEHGRNHNLVSELKFESLLAHALPGFIAVFISFFIFSYQFKRNQEAKELLNLSAEKQFLIQQINPHFLFNALNNIYSLTLDNNPKGSEAILKLSKMLDYSIYQVEDKLSTLGKEINYIENYLELYKLKDDEISSIQFDSENVNRNMIISPLLLLPFVENAIKHGNLDDIEHGRFFISFKTDNNTLYFKTNNSYDSFKKKDHVGGIGINNVTRRLELLYPNKHRLYISKNETEFNVELEIDLL